MGSTLTSFWNIALNYLGNTNTLVALIKKGYDLYSIHIFPQWSILSIVTILPCSGNLELSAKCFQELILKDQNHPAALVNYAALLLCKYASVVAGTLLLFDSALNFCGILPLFVIYA